MTFLLFTVALSLSAIAAYYAVAGLIAIFAASVVPIAIMGTLLEVAKLTVASWLYQGWKDIPKLMKVYFTIALITLMGLTSMGIFGFLSKAHLDQAVPSGDIAAKLALIDEKIKTEKENVNASRKELNQLDAQVDQTISRTTEASGTERAIAIRRGQAKDRARILNEIQASQAKIAKYNEERAPIASEVRKVEAEVGPIKYIAALIYGDNPDSDILEKSVRVVIMMIVAVFDPLAVLMLVAANWNLRNGIKSHWSSVFFKSKKEEEPKVVEPKPNTLIIKEELSLDDSVNIEQSTETELPEIKIDEPTKDWEPELYKRVPKKIDYDSAGRRITPETEEERAQKQLSKSRSFLNKVDGMLTPKTIEQEVDDIQRKK